MSYLLLAKQTLQRVRLQQEASDHTEAVCRFQERAAIREYDGNQSRVDAELGALADAMPWLRNGELCIPFDAPEKYQWWKGGQSLELTLQELGADAETIRRYVADKAGGVPKPVGEAV